MSAAANLSQLQQAWCLEAVAIIADLREVIDSRDKALGFEPLPDSATSESGKP